MGRQYNLPFRTRLALQLIKPKHLRPFHKMSPWMVRWARKPLPGLLAKLIFGALLPLETVEDITIPVRDGKIRGRLYRSKVKSGMPIILNFHGGGWTVGNLQNNDNYCNYLAHHLGALVISVDYRLAPEHKYPTAVQDAYDSLLWAYAHAAEYGGDVNRIGITGDSAGGNLAAATCLMARDMQGPAIKFQVLIYPTTETRLTFPSLDEHAHAPLLRKRDVEWFLGQYTTPDTDLSDPYLSPVQAPDLGNLPPAFLVMAGKDPLRDDGIAYAKRLKEAGNTVEHVVYENDIHGFITLSKYSESGKVALDRIVKAFSEKL